MRKRHFILYIIFGLIALAVFFGSSIVGLLTDWYWFQGIGFSNIFITILSAKILLGLGVGIFSFLVIYGNLGLAGRFIASRPIIISLRQRLQERSRGAQEMQIGKHINRLVLLISFIVSFFTGLFGASKWETVLQYFNFVPFNISDPIFGRDIAFYFFSLPFIQLVLGLVFWVIMVSLIVSAVIYGLGGAIALKQRALATGSFKPLFMEKRAKVHLFILIAFLFALNAFDIYAVKIPSLLYGSAGSFTGASYTDIHATLPLLKVLIVIAVAAAIIIFINAFKPGNRPVISIIGFYILVSFLGGWVYPTIMQKFVVLPNELAKETPYIKHNITGTRSAFALDEVIERDLTGEATITIDDINKNQSTIKNVRLWDREPLLDTFGQLQEIRTYYDFISIDNDRYYLDGDYRQVLLSPRELNPASLPQRTFINERLSFTHGFGLTFSPVNEVTPEGLPVLFIKDLPPSSNIESLSVTRPEIYYGELAGGWVAVNTGAKEFDYPSGEGNVFTVYEGTGGVEVQSIFRKALLALRFGSFKAFLSNDITNDSRIMYYRDIKERTKKVLPFLCFDGDPYLVITEEGELKWIYDAYTVSNRYPYAESVGNIFNSLPSRINYIRNSVKIVIDAYDGQMKFYISDSEDPIIKTYANIFKDVFLPMDEMSADLRNHIRYPEDLFAYQTALYTVYHMDEPQIFYNREDQWQVPSIASVTKADPMMRHMIMKLPGEEKEEFILMIPFTPRGKDNLSAWMVARNDDEHYGQMVVYRFPKQKLVFGPKQITDRISQDADISRQISLWDQRGSEVVNGNLLVIPVEESLIYVQPIYLRAEGGKIPELKRVIVAYENRIAMEKTLSLALERVFSGQITSSEKTVEIISDSSPSDSGLTQQANDHFNRAMQAQRDGDWSLYGEEIRKLGEILDKMK